MNTIVKTFPRSEMGVQKRGDKTFFRVWAPHAKSVAVSGTFNDWQPKNLPMQNEGNGYWFVETNDAGVGDEYQYIIESQAGEMLYRPDPYARQLTNSVGNSIIVDTDYDWGEDDFQIANWNELVIYEMHIGTFNVEKKGKPGTFASAIKKLKYLQDLGINAVEIMPIAEFAGDYSWGYNPAHPYGIETAYGGVKGFKDFVKAAHKHGIAVILDVVYNHFGPSDLGIWQFDGWSENDKGGIYFYNDWRSDTPWGDTRPDYGREEVRHYIFENAMMWLEDYRCDGLRMDMIPYMRSVKGIDDGSDDIPEGLSLLRWINGAVAEKYSHKLMIAEDLHSHDFITDNVENGGCGFGAQWDADFVHPVRKTLIAAEDAHRNMDSIKNALYNTYSNTVFSRVIYTESHDEIANGQARVTEEIANDNVAEYFSQKKSTLGAALMMTAPGIPMLFQGQELLEDKWFSDQDPIDWKRLKKFCGIHNLYKDLIRLRRNRDGTTKGLTGQHTRILHINQQNKILVMLRFFENPAEDGVIVIFNFSSQSYENYDFGIPVNAKWSLKFNSGWEGYSKKFDDFPVSDIKISKESYDGSPWKGSVTIGDYSALIFGATTN